VTGSLHPDAPCVRMPGMTSRTATPATGRLAGDRRLRYIEDLVATLPLNARAMFDADACWLDDADALRAACERNRPDGDEHGIVLDLHEQGSLTDGGHAVFNHPDARAAAMEWLTALGYRYVVTYTDVRGFGLVFDAGRPRATPARMDRLPSVRAARRAARTYHGLPA
jgi:hypothetical protein